MAETIDQCRVTFGTNIYEVGDVASNVMNDFGRDVKYLKHEDSQLMLTTKQVFHGQDEVSFSIRPASGGRSAVLISASQPNMAQNIAAEMAQHLPE